MSPLGNRNQTYPQAPLGVDQWHLRNANPMRPQAAAPMGQGRLRNANQFQARPINRQPLTQADKTLMLYLLSFFLRSCSGVCIFPNASWAVALLQIANLPQCVSAIQQKEPSDCENALPTVTTFCLLPLATGCNPQSVTCAVIAELADHLLGWSADHGLLDAFFRFE